MANNNCVALIGTGDYARAMALRLLRHGYHVTLHSRFPRRNTLASRCKELASVTILSWDESFNYASYVIVAVPDHAYSSLTKLSSSLAGRIVIDVSNPTSSTTGDKSNAEVLQDILPKSRVIKAFNSVSAYTLQSEASGENRTVVVYGDDLTSRQNVAQLARELGFMAVEGGALRQARHAEKIQRLLCSEWIKPMIVYSVLFILWTTYAIVRYFVIRDPPYAWYRLPTNVTNKIFGCVSLTLLGIVYLPGCIAAIVQFARGTKYRPFPAWLDGWMKMRKQLGLMALFTGWLHVLMSITILNSAYFNKWFDTSSVTVYANKTTDTAVAQDSRMNLNGELNVLFGLLGIAFMCLPGVASIPAVGLLLNWREWKLVQSGFGLMAMVFATTHVTLKGAYDWRNETAGEILQSMAFISSLLPWLCIALTIVFWMPCFCLPLRRIRAGWERGMHSDDHEAVTYQNDKELVDYNSFLNNAKTQSSYNNSPIATVDSSNNNRTKDSENYTTFI